jgi:biopolymer transport protein ExbD
MKGRFSMRKQTGLPAVNTASLPDIIFMLLFFFMVTTTLRQTTLMVKIQPPPASESEKIEKRSSVIHIYIGPPRQQELGNEPRIQINDAFATLSDIVPFIERERMRIPEEDQASMTVSLKIDEKTHMGVVTDVKQQLRKANALNINYGSRKKSKSSY